jgi:hypothetical protein
VVSSVQTSSLTWAISDATSALFHATQHANDTTHPHRDAIADAYRTVRALELLIGGES